jgi:hypothetical protein
MPSSLTDESCGIVPGMDFFVRGDSTGLSIPAHGDVLRGAGESFLTEAFRVFGSLGAHNRVTRITRWERCPGGSTGEKFFLSVEYDTPSADLHGDLFVKFSRDFNDPIRDDRGKHEMESEVRFAAVSRLPAFPINVPKAYFADYHHESRTGILITQRIAFGVGEVQSHRPKCMDHELADPLHYYQTIVSALARIAAAHRAGRLGPDIDASFPYDARAAAAENPIPYDESQLHDLVQQYAGFAKQCPQLLPASVRSAAFIEKLDREVVRFRRHEAEIGRFLQSNCDLIALCHWNAQIDNAWFWRDCAGELRCGLMDWGRVNQMNVAFSLWGCLSGAGLAIWERHLDDLLAQFVREYQQGGGPRVAVSELKRHLLLYAGLMGLCYFLASPARILFRLPAAATAAGPLDPIFRTSDPARNNLHMLAVVMRLWCREDFGGLLDGC